MQSILILGRMFSITSLTLIFQWNSWDMMCWHKSNTLVYFWVFRAVYISTRLQMPSFFVWTIVSSLSKSVPMRLCGLPPLHPCSISFTISLSVFIPSFFLTLSPLSFANPSIYIYPCLSIVLLTSPPPIFLHIFLYFSRPLHHHSPPPSSPTPSLLSAKVRGSWWFPESGLPTLPVWPTKTPVITRSDYF